MEDPCRHFTCFFFFSPRMPREERIQKQGRCLWQSQTCHKVANKYFVIVVIIFLPYWSVYWFLEMNKWAYMKYEFALLGHWNVCILQRSNNIGTFLWRNISNDMCRNYRALYYGFWVINVSICKEMPFGRANWANCGVWQRRSWCITHYMQARLLHFVQTISSARCNKSIVHVDWTSSFIEINWYLLNRSSIN